MANIVSPVAGDAATAVWAATIATRLNGSATFPVSPASNDIYWRTDLGMEFVYNGTRWVSTQLFQMPIPISDVLNLFTTTAAGSHRAASPALNGGSDIWLEDSWATFYVLNGTDLAAGHKWVAVLSKATGAASLSTLDTVTIDSGSELTWRSENTTIDALMGSTYLEFESTITRTGTPGNLYFHWVVSYRIVAV